MWPSTTFQLCERLCFKISPLEYGIHISPPRPGPLIVSSTKQQCPKTFRGPTASSPPVASKTKYYSICTPPYIYAVAQKRVSQKWPGVYEKTAMGSLHHTAVIACCGANMITATLKHVQMEVQWAQPIFSEFILFISWCHFILGKQHVTWEKNQLQTFSWREKMP